MNRGFRKLLLPFVLALLVAAALPVAADQGLSEDSERATTVKLVVRTYYRTYPGKAPLPGVEIFAMIGGIPHYACSDANGRAVFKGLTPGDTVLMLATGLEVAASGCTNPKYRNPMTNDKMLAVFYNNHHGVRVWDSLTLPTTGKAVVKLIARTPKNQKKICAGLKTTQVGSAGNDIIVGTNGKDVINARGGDDIVQGLDDNDWLCGGGGFDELLGGAGDDWLWGEAGPDLLDGGADIDWMSGGGGVDTCISGETLFKCEL